MVYSQICLINNNQVILNFPSDFNGKKIVRVTLVDDKSNKNVRKIQLLKRASADILFNNDVNEIMNFFG